MPHRGLANAHRLLGHYEQAAEALQQVTALEPEDISSKFGLGEVYEKLGRSGEAIEVFRAVMEMKPKEELRQTDFGRFHAQRYCIWAAHHRVAAIYRDQGRYSDALDVYNQVVSKGIDSFDTHYGLGLTYAALGFKGSALAQHAILKHLADVETLDVMKKIFERDADDLLKQIQK